MRLKRKLLIVSSILLAPATAAWGQLTCGGTLSCNTTTPAYSIVNSNSTGDALSVNANGGVGLRAAGTYSYAIDAFSAVQGGSPSSNAAVHAEGYYAHGLFAETGGGGNGGYAVKAIQTQTIGTGGYGVYGESKLNTGVYGKADAAGKFGVYASGNLGASGTKTFVEPHPTDASKEIQYAALEGPEAGTYFRGTARIVNGIAVISVPEDFRMVTDEKGLTVHLTPMGELALVACTKKDLNQIVIQGSKNVEVDFLVHGVRKAFVDFRPIVENRDFIPGTADDSTFATGLPEESLRRLRSNGTLNEDGSVSVETASRLGWDRQANWTLLKASDSQ